MHHLERRLARGLFGGLVAAALGCGGTTDNPIGPGANHAPVIRSVTASPSVVPLGGTSVIRVDATDPDGDRLFYSYGASSGTVVSDPANPGQATYTHNGAIRAADDVTVTVVDSKNASVQGRVTVALEGNHGPQVEITGGGSCHPPCTINLTAAASDPEGDSLTYLWFGCTSGTGRTASCALAHPGRAEAAVVVSDGRGGIASASAGLTGGNRPPSVTAPNGVEFAGGRARFNVFYDDPDGDTLVCGWWGYCQCTGSNQSYNLDCVLPPGQSSCLERMSCTDSFGASTEVNFNLRP